MISILQYQTYCKIPTGTTSTEQYKSIAPLIGLDLSTLTSNEVELKVKQWVSEIIISKKEHTKIRLGTKWYKVDRDLYSLAFAQWIYFDDTMRGADEKNVYDIMHFLIATFLREYRFGKFFPKQFNVNNIGKTAKIVQEKMDIPIALEMINFFFQCIILSINNTRTESLERSDRASWEVTND